MHFNFCTGQNCHPLHPPSIPRLPPIPHILPPVSVHPLYPLHLASSASSLQKMHSYAYTLLVCALLCAFAQAFHTIALRSSKRSSPMGLQMGNNAAFGIFSPAVIVAKAVLGDAKLNKVRIGSYCHYCRRNHPFLHNSVAASASVTPTRPLPTPLLPYDILDIAESPHPPPLTPHMHAPPYDVSPSLLLISCAARPSRCTVRPSQSGAYSTEHTTLD
jgi:hypothetical protein